MTTDTGEAEPIGGFALFLVICAGVGLAVVVGCLVLQVLGRTVFVRPWAWTGELARFAAVWAALLAAAAAYELAALHRVDVLVARLPSGLQAVTFWLQLGLVLTVCVFLVFYGHAMVERTWNQRSSAMGVSMAWVYAALPVAALAMTATALKAGWQRVRA
ncbi:MAG: TRAP transporter small permease subunit [Geminicoccaceae bacterium]|nr:MAG: TRAP transporter small permease subunit [Geminicoccaceae bacterium]